MIAQRPCPTRTLDDDHSTNTQNHLFRINNDLQSSYWPIEGSPAAIDPALVQRVFHQSLVPTSTYSDTEFLFSSSSSSSRIESTAPMSFGTAPSDNFSAPSLVPHRFPRGRDKQVISRRRQRPAREFCRECDSLDFTVKRSLESKSNEILSMCSMLIVLQIISWLNTWACVSVVPWKGVCMIIVI